MNLTPPQNLEIEEFLLSSCFLGDGKEICEILKPEHFYKMSHQTIFRAIVNVTARKLNVDLPTVLTTLKTHKRLEEVGGAVSLANIIDGPISTNIEHHCEQLKNLSALRKLIVTCSEIQQKAFTATDPLETIDEAQALITGIEVGSRNGSSTPIEETCFELSDEIGERSKNPKDVTGIPSGFDKIDKTLHGFQPSDLIILGARPSMGKSALMSNVSQYASKENYPVAILSLEMSRKQLTYRILAQRTSICLDDLLTGNVTFEQQKMINVALGEISELPIYIDDSASLTIFELRRRLRRMKRDHNIKIAFVDYLQLVKGEKELSRDREIAGVSAGLKATAKELEIPIVALSQLNRKIEERQNKRPVLSDLRDSGTLEQDADIIMLLYRPEPYILEKYDSNGKETDNYKKAKNSAELNIAKHRNGSTGVTHLCWLPESTSFENLFRGVAI